MYNTEDEKPPCSEGRITRALLAARRLRQNKARHDGRAQTKVPQVLRIVPIHFVDAGRGVPDQTFAPGLGPDVNAIYPLRDTLKTSGTANERQ